MELLTEEALRPYWLGTVRTYDAEYLWGGLGARNSVRVDAEGSLTLELQWLRRITERGMGCVRITDRAERIMRFTPYGVSRIGDLLRVHCGNVILYFKPRPR